MTAEIQAARARTLISVLPADLPRDRARPTDSDIAAAMRLLPIALENSPFSGLAWLPRDPSDRALLYPSWLAYADERGVRRSAAEWAIVELSEQGLVTVDRSAADGFACAHWELVEGHLLRISSTPALWEWRNAGPTPEPAAPAASEASEAEPVDPLRGAPDWAARAVGYISTGKVKRIADLHSLLVAEGYPHSRQNLYNLPGVKSVAKAMGWLKEQGVSVRRIKGSKDRHSRSIEAIQPEN